MSKRPNEKNERLKRRYLEYRKYAGQLSEKSLDREISALEQFDIWNGRKDFARFHIEQAMGFRTHLENSKSKTGKPLAKSSMRAILKTLRGFILWLSQRDGYRSKIKAADADYFNLSRRDEAVARAAPQRPAPSISQAKYALGLMPSNTPHQKRDKAVFALLCLTGIRVAALASLKIKHIDLREKSVTQNPREVATKFGKPIDTFFVKEFEDAENALADWLTYLDQTALYGPDDPLFPTTAVQASIDKGFTVAGFNRNHWKSTEPIRKIVKKAFESANLPNYGPHAFRHMLARHVAKNCVSVAELVATSQNLGHTDVLTTLRSYGQISRDEQRRLVTGDKD